VTKGGSTEAIDMQAKKASNAIQIHEGSTDGQNAVTLTERNEKRRNKDRDE